MVKNKGRAAPIALLAFLLMALYYPIITKLVMHWYKDPDYSHGFLIPFISGYLIWEKRERLRLCPAKPDNTGIVLLLAGLILLIVAKAGAELFIMRFSLILVIAGLILYLGGRELLKCTLVPLAYLVFMIPLPAIIYNELTFPLKLMAAKYAAFLVQLIGIPLYREGNLIYLENVTLEVVDACSGIRSLMSMLALGVALAYFWQKTIWKALILILSVLPITILANILRVVGTAIFCHYYGEKAALGFYHEFSGLMIFMAGFLMLTAVGILLRKV